MAKIDQNWSKSEFLWN